MPTLCKADKQGLTSNRAGGLQSFRAKPAPGLQRPAATRPWRPGRPAADPAESPTAPCASDEKGRPHVPAVRTSRPMHGRSAPAPTEAAAEELVGAEDRRSAADLDIGPPGRGYRHIRAEARDLSRHATLVLLIGEATHGILAPTSPGMAVKPIIVRGEYSFRRLHFRRASESAGYRAQHGGNHQHRSKHVQLHVRREEIGASVPQIAPVGARPSRSSSLRGG
jgi:hypothetical protein